jgi:hypothetical protein
VIELVVALALALLLTFMAAKFDKIKVKHTLLLFCSSIYY